LKEVYNKNLKDLNVGDSLSFCDNNAYCDDSIVYFVLEKDEELGNHKMICGMNCDGNFFIPKELW
jgi:hypothetical protein